MSSTPARPPLEVYCSAWSTSRRSRRLQRRLVYDLGERGGGALVLCEHPPTISVGRTGSRLHIVPDDDELAAARHPGPLGQPRRRAASCTCPASSPPISPCRWSRSGSTSAATSTGCTTPSSGSWPSSTSGDDPARGPRRLPRPCPGGLGGRGRRPLDRLSRVDPERRPVPGPFDDPRRARAGSWPLRQTSMESRRQRPAPMPKVREALIRHLEDVFGLERHHVYTAPSPDPPEGPPACLRSKSWMSGPACRPSPVVADRTPPEPDRARPRRLPAWLKRPIPAAGGMYFTKNLVGELGLETVCESAQVPEPLGVLDPPDRHVHDPGRRLHPALRLLRRASGASPRPSPTTSPTAWPRPAPGSA